MGAWDKDDSPPRWDNVRLHHTTQNGVHFKI